VREKGKWIQKAIKKPGALRAQLKAKGMHSGNGPIPSSLLHKLAKGNSKLARRARLAITLKGMHHSAEAPNLTEIIAYAESHPDFDITPLTDYVIKRVGEAANSEEEEEEEAAIPRADAPDSDKPSGSDEQYPGGSPYG